MPPKEMRARTMLDCCECLFTDTRFMSTLTRFKDFMAGDSAPTYVRRYCGALDDPQWEWFYGQMKAAFKVTDELEYLFYVLKWILKRDFDDLIYEMYCQDVFNPECRKESLIKFSSWKRCAAKYRERFEVDHAYLWADDADCGEALDHADGLEHLGSLIAFTLFDEDEDLPF